MYGNRESFHIKSLSIGVLLALVAYYAVIVFHWDEIINAVTHPHFAIISAAFLPSLIKGGLFFRLYRKQKSISKAIKSVAIITYYLVGIAASAAAIIYLAGLLSRLISSSYWERTHWFWISISLFLILGYAYLLLKNFGLIRWKLLADLKAIPIVSPVFCFGGPVLWSKNLSYASLDPKLLSVYSTLTIISGAIFLCYLLVFAAFNQRFGEKKAADTEHSLLYNAEGQIKVEQRISEPNATKFCLAILGAGLFSFLLVILDIVLALAQEL